MPYAKSSNKRHSVSLRPDADFTRFIECIVIPFNGFLTVIRDRGMIALEIDADRAPYFGWPRTARLA